MNMTLSISSLYCHTQTFSKCSNISALKLRKEKKRKEKLPGVLAMGSDTLKSRGIQSEAFSMIYSLSKHAILCGCSHSTFSKALITTEIHSEYPLFICIRKPLPEMIFNLHQRPHIPRDVATNNNIKIPVSQNHTAE